MQIVNNIVVCHWCHHSFLQIQPHIQAFQKLSQLINIHGRAGLGERGAVAKEQIGSLLPGKRNVCQYGFHQFFQCGWLGIYGFYDLQIFKVAEFLGHDTFPMAGDFTCVNKLPELIVSQALLENMCKKAYLYRFLITK